MFLFFSMFSACLQLFVVLNLGLFIVFIVFVRSMVVADHQCPHVSPCVYLTVSVFALGAWKKQLEYKWCQGEMECEHGPYGVGETFTKRMDGSQMLSSIFAA